MIPSFSEIYKSFYYKNTYLLPVNLSYEGISKHLPESEDDKILLNAQKLISLPEVQAVLSEPLSYDPLKILENNKVLEKHGFKLLARRFFPAINTHNPTPFYTAIEHNKLKGWVIKSGATRVLKDQILQQLTNDKHETTVYNEEESILRIEMAKRVAKVAHKANIDVIIPKKKLVAYSNLNSVKEPNRKYCIVCEKINVLSFEETIQTITNMDEAHQKELAQKISTIVQKAGLVASLFKNIRLTPEGKLAFINTKPSGLMVVKKPGIWNTLFSSKGASVEKCARIGLYNLMLEVSQYIPQYGFFPNHAYPRFEAFHNQIKSDYEKLATPELSKWKIGLSIVSIGLIPLINAIAALIKIMLMKRTLKNLEKLDKTERQKREQYLKEKVPEYYNPDPFQFHYRHQEFQQNVVRKWQFTCQKMENEKFVKDFREQRMAIQKQLSAYTEGVPFNRPKFLRIKSYPKLQ